MAAAAYEFNPLFFLSNRYGKILLKVLKRIVVDIYDCIEIVDLGS